MRNQDRYKTAQERAEAFINYCEGRSNMTDNQCLCDTECHSCHFAWLELEADEEKPLPCPFCGDEVKLLKAENHRYLQCNNCNCTYSSGGAFSEVEAIAAHNRVAKAANEIEAKHEAH